MEVSKQALQNIISDEDRLLFAENIPAEYLSDALGRRPGTAMRSCSHYRPRRSAACSGTPTKTPSRSRRAAREPIWWARQFRCSVVSFWMYPA